MLCIPSTRKKKKKKCKSHIALEVLPDAGRLMTKDDLSTMEQVPNPEIQRGHGTLNSGPLAEKLSLQGRSRTFLLFLQQHEVTSLYLCPTALMKAPVQGKGPFQALILSPARPPHFLPQSRWNQNVCQPPSPQADCQPGPRHSLGETPHSKGNGKRPSPFSDTTQTLGLVLASALALHVWVTVEGRGRETSESSGILGSGPTSDIYCLDGPGWLKYLFPHL